MVATVLQSASRLKIAHIAALLLVLMLKLLSIAPLLLVLVQWHVVLLLKRLVKMQKRLLGVQVRQSA